MNDSNSTISPGWPTHWPKDSFSGFTAWATGIVIVAIVVLSAIGSAQQVSGPVDPQRLVFGLTLQALLETGLISCALLALPSIAKIPRRALGFTAPTLTVFVGAVLGAIAMIVVVDGSSAIVSILTHTDHQQQPVEVFAGLHQPAAIAAFVLFATVFAPAVEETIFRVFVFNFGMRYGGFWLGAAASGVLFACAHGDKYAAIPLGLGGVVLCAVYYNTRNAYASMISHALFNAFTLVALLMGAHAAAGHPRGPIAP
ncbi:MAG TPA: type II CAAX endopeptidase family protein [Candidatus Tumulicola sp.]